MDRIDIRLTDDEIALFRKLSQNKDGRVMLGYLEKLRRALFDHKVLTPENFLSRKDTVLVIESLIEDRIKRSGEEKSVDVQEYE